MTAARSHTAEDTAAHALAAGNATLSYEGAGRRKLRKKKKSLTRFCAYLSFLAQRRSEQAIAMGVGIAWSHVHFHAYSRP